MKLAPSNAHDADYSLQGSDMDMLERLKQLEAAGAWAEIVQLAPALPAGLSGDDLARACLSTSKAFEETATCAADYRTAISFTQKAIHTTVAGSPLHTWSLARAAAMLADTGAYSTAMVLARSFFAALPDNPGAAPMEPYAAFALGRALSRTGRHGEALMLLHQAYQSTTGALQERIQVALMRAWVRSGRIQGAVKVRPEVKIIDYGHLAAADAIFCAHVGDWQGAYDKAKTALAHHRAGGWKIYDVVELAELLLTLKRAALALGRPQEAAVWFMQTTALLADWTQELVTLLLSTLRQGGGVFVDAASSHRGAAGHHRCGLRGCVG